MLQDLKAFTKVIFLLRLGEKIISWSLDSVAEPHFWRKHIFLDSVKDTYFVSSSPEKV